MNQKDQVKKATAPFFLVNNTNSTKESFLTGTASFLALFEEMCKNNSQRALICDNDQLTYQQLDTRSNQFANFYKSRGISSGDLVGICLERNIQLVPALLGILKAGACYVPLDPHFPQSRLSYMIEHSKLKYIICTENLTDRFGCDKSVNIILIDKESTPLQNSSTTNPEVPLHGEMIAYTIYTSGSTGKPKGVQIHHKALLNFLLSMQKEPGISASDRMLAITTLSFDISCLELYLPLISGAAIVLASSEIARDANRLIEYIATHQVTLMQATPSTYQMLLDLNWKNTSVQKLLCGGEAMSIDLGNKLQTLCGEVWNMYGPTETTVWSSIYRLKGKNDKPVLGKPIDNTSLILLDEALQPVDKMNGEGELYIGGQGLSKGYLSREDLTNERFIPCPFPDLQTEKLYKTGDICRYNGEGNIEYIGRSDFQVKIRGYRIELGEIENTILQSESVKQCVVTVREDVPGFKKLVAYIIESGNGIFSAVDQKNLLKAKLPDYMIPDLFVSMASFPLTPNGKIDRNALPKPGKDRPELSSQYIQPVTETEKTISQVWSSLLSIDKIGTDDNFFDLGGNSLLGIRASNILLGEYGIDIPIVKLFEFPTVSKLATYLSNKDGSVSTIDQFNERATYQRIGRFTNDTLSDGVAIIGMSGRFPGADTIDELWNNLCNSVESITRFTKEEAGPGIEPELLNDPDYILARGIINDADKFDAAFFGISPSEAKLMDPQHRVFLELAYQSLENAGYDPEQFPGMIGVYAGAGDNFYYTNNVLYHKDLINMVGKTVVGYGNFKDYIATRASYHLNLTGPGVSLNTGCSTTLLSVDYAFQGLINHECDMALAGGIDICVPQKSGFLYQLNGTFAKDGHCRPFDAEATGTMFCDGAGIVVLKRLKDAVRDRDKIYAVIRGSAKNNDGYNKASFLAPSSEGQSKVIAMAQAIANVSAADIGYIEAHGTGTPIGDPIEIEGLTKAFRLHTDKNRFCYISSIKGNIGHPTNAAGIAGLIKAALCLYHEKIPATMHFKNPNPKIDFEQTPFIVTTELTEWKKSEKPRIAGVSSFGFGGTNVHTILGETPVVQKVVPSKRPFHLFPISAKTETSLDALSSSFAEFFKKSNLPDLADISYTLETGRRNHPYRRFIVANSFESAATNFASLPPGYAGELQCKVKEKAVCFMFPGQGSQYIGMGKNYYDTEPLFREIVDHCASVLNQYLKKDILEILFKNERSDADEFDSLMNTYYTQPAIFTIEYAFARLLMSWGIVPAAMVGHSIGEFVCATLSGIFELDDALRLIALRGRLISELPHGSMLSVRKNIADVEPLLPANIQLAAFNSPDLCVVAGPTDAITAFSKSLEEKGIVSRPLHTSHAFHSAMMDPALETFIGEVKKITLSKPKIPFLSTLTTQWINQDNPPDADYWGRHMRQPVLFSKAIDTLLREEKYVFIEIGPRNTLSTLARQHVSAPVNPVVSLLSDTSENFEECRAVQNALGILWMNGVPINWADYYKDEIRYKVPLPLYPFDRTRFWVDPPADSGNLPQFDSTETASATQVLTVTEPEAPKTSEDDVIAVLTSSISEVFGRDISSFGKNATFIEMGMDSLFLTQVAYKIQEKFGIKITFGHLLKDYPNIKKLSEFIIAKNASAPPAKQVIRSASSSTTAVSSKHTATTSLAKPGSPDTGGDCRNSPILEKVVLEQSQTISRLVTLLEKGGIPQQNASSDQKMHTDNTTGNNQQTAAAVQRQLTVQPTPSQQGILFSSKLADELSISYNESITLTFTGQINIPVLKDGIKFLVERYDALRATFNADGSIMQIAPSMEITIPVDVPGSGNRAEKVKQLIKKEVGALFNLDKGPLFRAKIIKSGKHEVTVVLTAHHTICDGWSLDVLIFDLCEFYASKTSNRQMSQETVYSFADFVQTITARAQLDDYQRMKQFWLKKASAKFPLQELPADHPRKSVKRFDAHRIDLPINTTVYNGLKQLSKQYGCSLYTVILSGISLLLYRIFGDKDFVLALAMAEQSFMSKNRLVGNCVDLLPFITTIQEKQQYGDYLAEVQAEIISIMDNHEYTLIELMRDLEKKPGESSIAHATAGLTHIKMFEKDDFPAGNYEVSYQVNPKIFENFEIYFIALESKNALELKCSYNTTLFDERTIRNWISFLESIFAGIVKNSNQILGNLFTLPADETKRLAENRLKNGSNHQTQQIIHPSSENRQENIIETQLLELWRQLLGKKAVDTTSNFFSIGGHSLMAAELFARIEKQFGKNLPLSTLYKYPTVEGLAGQILAQTAGQKWRSLVPIQPEGHKPPLYLVHGAEGNVLLYRDLAQHLGKNQPVFGLQSIGLDGSTDFNPEFRATAAAYLEEIREFQPQGPYYLGGYCLGGSIAFEMARQLTAAGEKTNLVAMFENYNVQAMKWPQPPHLQIANKVLNIAFHLKNLFAADNKILFFKEKAGVEWSRFKISNRIRFTQLVAKFGKKSGVAYKHLFVDKAFDEALIEYIPEPWDGKIAIFIARDRFAGFTDPMFGWKDLATKGIDMYELPIAPRGSMVEPYVKLLAERLSEALEKARNEGA